MQMRFDTLIGMLAERLQGPLPGPASQWKMSSNTRLRELMKSPFSGEAVPSSVLMLLYPVGGEPWMVFIQRPQYEGVHSGQIAFPGGKAEPGDLNPEDTALRESREEVGIDPSHVHLLGKLTDLYIPPSNYLVTPVVGYSDTHPHFVTDPAEVEGIIEIPFRMILSDKCIEPRKFIVRHGTEIEAPAFVIDGHAIWGATAMMLSELRDVVRR